MSTKLEERVKCFTFYLALVTFAVAAITTGSIMHLSTLQNLSLSKALICGICTSIAYCCYGGLVKYIDRVLSDLCAGKDVDVADKKLAVYGGLIAVSLPLLVIFCY